MYLYKFLLLLPLRMLVYVDAQLLAGLCEHQRGDCGIMQHLA